MNPPRAERGLRVLSMNVGSSSLKFALFEFAADGGERQLVSGAAERIGQAGARLRVRDAAGHEQQTPSAIPDAGAALKLAFAALRAHDFAELDAVGHRLVHGGPDHLQPARVDDGLLAALRDAVKFAPLHLPAELDAIEHVRQQFPELPQVVCFDTAFHAALPEIARRLPLPAQLDEAGLRRYGFHGLSYEYLVTQLGAAKLGRAVLAHLGSGASLAAVRDGKPVDTTMGLTPLGGVMMGTRSGDLDPGVLLQLLSAGYDAKRLERLLEHESGLLGVSGTSSDVEQLLQSRDSDARAALALDMFAYQIRKTIAAFAAALGGIDSLVFSGGIGAHAPAVRSAVCEPLAWLGARIDAEANRSSAPVISTAASRFTVHVLPTDEERMIARHTRQVIAPAQ
jgi:acetate kinase